MKTFKEFMSIAEGFKPANELKMKNQMKKHLNSTGADDNRYSNMHTAIKVIVPQQKSKGFAEKKTEKGKRTFAKQNADKFLLKDPWHGQKIARGHHLTVPGRHITRTKEGEEKHLEKLRKNAKR